MVEVTDLLVKILFILNPNIKIMKILHKFFNLRISEILLIQIYVESV